MVFGRPQIIVAQHEQEPKLLMQLDLFFKPLIGVSLIEKQVLPEGQITLSMYEVTSIGVIHSNKNGDFILLCFWQLFMSWRQS